jgi:hypothetical protein
VFPDGTIFYKELQLTLPGQNPDGSRTEPSGRATSQALPLHLMKAAAAATADAAS